MSLEKHLFESITESDNLDPKKFNQAVQDVASHIDGTARLLWEEAYPSIESKNLARVFRIAFFLSVQEAMTERLEKQ